MASELKRQLLAMNAKRETNSTSSKGVVKPGGSARFFEKDKTGSDRTPLAVPNKKAKTTGKSQVTYKASPVGKATPKGKNPGKGPAKMSGKLGKLWGQ